MCLIQPGGSIGIAVVAALVAIQPSPLAAQTPPGTPPAAPPPQTEEREPPDDEGRGDIGWQDYYIPANWVDLVVAGTFLTGFILVETLTEAEEEPRWEGGVLFDDAVRDWFVADSFDGRDRADLASDVFWYLGSAYPLVDAVVVVGLVHEHWDISWQLGVWWLESTAFTGFISRLTQREVARERPLRPECFDDPAYSPLCGGPSANTSFISGHTAGAMAGAGQTCAVHQFLDLYGSDLGGTLACAGNITLGLLAGILRMTADKHWATDVIVGGAVGFSVGYLVPWLHFTLGKPDDSGVVEPSTVITPWATAAGGLGVKWTGLWAVAK